MSTPDEAAARGITIEEMDGVIINPVGGLATLALTYLSFYELVSHQEYRMNWLISSSLLLPFLVLEFVLVAVSEVMMDGVEAEMV